MKKIGLIIFKISLLLFTLNSKGSDTKQNFFKNSLPYGYYSEGRKISGEVWSDR